MNELKTFREQMNMTQTDLGKMCGVTKPTVCSWEKGTRKPDIVTLKRLAMIFGCTADDLLASIPVPDVEGAENGNA